MNYIIWIVIGAIFVIMAIIGYVAEHSGNKNVRKEQVNIPEVNVSNIETKEETATWSLNAKPKDEKQEILHKVPSMDDWTKIPSTEDKLPEVKLDVPKEEVKGANVVENQPMFADVVTSKSNISEPTGEVLSVEEPATTPIPTPVPAQPQPVEPVMLPATNDEVKPSLVVSSESSEPVLSSLPQINGEMGETSDSSQATSESLAGDVVSSNSEPTTTPISEQGASSISTENIWN